MNENKAQEFLKQLEYERKKKLVKKKLNDLLKVAFLSVYTILVQPYVLFVCLGWFVFPYVQSLTFITYPILVGWLAVLKAITPKISTTKYANGEVIIEDIDLFVSLALPWYTLLVAFIIHLFV